MSRRLIDALSTIEAVADAFSDASVLDALLAVEVGLARVQARLGLIPASAASAIGAAAASAAMDVDAIARDARATATPIIPFVRALTAHTRAVDPVAAGFVHWGVTSQDVADTAFSLCLKRAHAAIAADHARLSSALVALSDEHAGTVMLGRTLLQPAPPVTFGLKAAGWYAAAARGWARLEASAIDAIVLQFGGASGTLAALGEAGPEVARQLAGELTLGEAPAPWHTQRDRLAAFAAAHGVYVGSLGKIARDVSLLMQDEIGEVAEPGGGSSTMPHKRNPAGSAITLAAAARVPGLVAAVLTSMVQEHERGVGGWHAEWPTIAAIVEATGSAQSALAGAVAGLTVDGARMRANLDAAGVVCAERVMMRLGGAVGRDVAHALVADAVERSRQSGRTFADELVAMPEVVSHVAEDDLRALARPDTYIGAAEAIRQRLLGRPLP